MSSSSTTVTETTSFNLEYIVSVIAALGSAYAINASQPAFSPVLTYFVVPMLTAFVTLKIITFIFPKMNSVGSNTTSYLQYGAMDSLSNMGYMEVFPPLFAILIIFIILLYNRTLG